MARTRKQPADKPGDVELIVPNAVVEIAATEVKAPEPEKPKRTRTRKPTTTTAKSNGIPAAAAAPVAAETQAMSNLMGDARTLQHQLGDATRQAEEARLILQSLRHQQGEFERHFDGLRQVAEKTSQEAARQSEEVRGQVEALRQSHEQVGGEVARLREEAEAVHRELRKTLQEAAGAKTDLAATTARLSEAERLFRQTAQELIGELRSQLDPVRKTLGESVPHLEAFPAESARVLQRLEQTTRALPEALLQLQRLERQGEEAERRLETLRAQTKEEEGRLESLRRQVVQEQERPKETSSAETPLVGQQPMRLGLTVGPGVVVDEVTAGSSAEAAGLLVNDVIQAVNGIRVLDGPEVQKLVQRSGDGEPIVLTLSRAGADVTLNVPAVVPSEEGGKPALGLTVHPGVVVSEVMPGSPAESAGLVRGDVIQAANGTPVVAGEQIRQAVLWEQLRRAVPAEPGGAATTETDLSLVVSRGGEVREVRVPLGQQPQGA